MGIMKGHEVLIMSQEDDKHTHFAERFGHGNGIARPIKGSIRIHCQEVGMVGPISSIHIEFSGLFLHAVMRNRFHSRFSWVSSESRSIGIKKQYVWAVLVIA